MNTQNRYCTKWIIVHNYCLVVAALVSVRNIQKKFKSVLLIKLFDNYRQEDSHQTDQVCKLSQYLTKYFNLMELVRVLNWRFNGFVYRMNLHMYVCVFQNYMYMSNLISSYCITLSADFCPVEEIMETDFLGDYGVCMLGLSVKHRPESFVWSES